MKVVVDANIFVFALATPGSRAEQAMQRIIEGRDQLIISRAIIKELLTTLSRKFSRDREELAHVAVYLAEIGRRVEPKRTLDVLADGPDNRILECALAGQADILVTGDRALLALGQYEGVKIIPLHEYLM